MANKIDLTVTYFAVLISVMLTLSTSLPNYEAEKEIDGQYEEEAHPFGEDGLKKPEPGLSQTEQSLADTSDDRPRYCTRPEDCYPGECCTIQMMRYSQPRCLPYGSVNDQCIIQNSKFNTTLYYPRSSLQVTDIYRIFCPCQQHLLCVSGNKCVHPNEDHYLNDNALPSLINP